MKTVIKYQTADGCLFDDRAGAMRHIDKNYGNLLTSIAHRMANNDSYFSILEFIDENLDDFVRLAVIKKDFELVKEDEQD